MSMFQAQGAKDLYIPVQGGAQLMARAHLASEQAVNILFFHGNGEIVSDFDQLAQVYIQLDISFIPVDYRGYGKSSGSPSLTSMLQDAHLAMDFVRSWLKEQGRRGPLLVMGRSLGSAPALELAVKRQQELSGLIIESGFAYTMPLLRLLGIDLQALGLDEPLGLGNLDKMAQVRLPCLVMHAELDQIIPISEARALYQACPAAKKAFQEIPGANHNDIFLRDLKGYMAAIRELVGKAQSFGQT
jgi:hypothetical protein